MYRYNKREDDFPSLREYNDYLEEVEDMSKNSNHPNYQSYWDSNCKRAILTWKLYIAVFNLIEGIDVQAIEEKIQQYQQENAEQIMINQARKVFVF